jgi:hypothetical protein
MPGGEITGALTTPVEGLVEGSVHGAGPLRVRAPGRVQCLKVRLGERPPHVRCGKQPGKRNGQGCLLLRHLTVTAARPPVVCLPADELLWHPAGESRRTVVTKYRLPQHNDSVGCAARRVTSRAGA